MVLVYATKRNDEQGFSLFSGSLEDCKSFCKKITPFEWDSVNIDKENGEIVLRIVRNGRPSEDYHQLLGRSAAR